MSEIALRISGVTRPIVFTWGELAELRQKFGIDFQSVINRALGEQDFAIMAEIVACGARGGGALVTADEVMRGSPPIARAIEVISLALSHAYHGPRVEGLERPLAGVRAMMARVAAMFTRKRLTPSLA